ncbi:hypothetical protein BU17DRAFT_67220 [Hysterangium stoloniferum]|nr:hypothetical protein BU17DRAFT_67220 [Hysterangium stoloniferum]
MACLELSSKSMKQKRKTLSMLNLQTWLVKVNKQHFLYLPPGPNFVCPAGGWHAWKCINYIEDGDQGNREASASWLVVAITSITETLCPMSHYPLYCSSYKNTKGFSNHVRSCKQKMEYFTAAEKFKSQSHQGKQEFPTWYLLLKLDRTQNYIHTVPAAFSSAMSFESKELNDSGSESPSIHEPEPYHSNNIEQPTSSGPYIRVVHHPHSGLPDDFIYRDDNIPTPSTGEALLHVHRLSYILPLCFFV